jgi:4-amino-4-deoxy-L-arabinose transferase-like glycosyltransferase
MIYAILNRLSYRLILNLVILISILPFLNERVLRMAGDEKVYISQSIEMFRDHRWFVQTLANEPNYFKGPFHYVLTHLGLIIFGKNLIAGLWFNLLLIILAANLLFNFFKKFFSEEVSLLFSLICTLNVGIVSHTYASQMEVSLSMFYLFAFIFLAKSTLDSSFKDELIFWVITGMIGWIKSPLHSVLVGSSAILFWILSKTILQKIKSPKTYLAIFLGITVCILGYMPTLIFDFKNFYELYFIRENTAKVNNNRPASYVLLPLIHFFLPWTLLIFTKLKNLKSLFNKEPTSKLALIALSISIPTIIFFSTFRYKGQNYNLPAGFGLILAPLILTKGNFNKTAITIIGWLTLILSMIFLFIVLHFYPLPSWWSMKYVFFTFISLILSGAIFIIASDIKAIAFGAMMFFLAFGLIITPLGKREMIGINEFIRQNPDVILHYDDLNPSIWNEWGLLTLSIHKDIFVIHKPEDLNLALEPNHAIITQTEDGLKYLKQKFEEKYIQNKDSKLISPTSIIIPWKRWLTKGRSPQNENMLIKAYKEKDLSLLEREFYIFFIKNN